MPSAQDYIAEQGGNAVFCVEKADLVAVARGMSDQVRYRQASQPCDCLAGMTPFLKAGALSEFGHELDLVLGLGMCAWAVTASIPTRLRQFCSSGLLSLVLELLLWLNTKLGLWVCEPKSEPEGSRHVLLVLWERLCECLSASVANSA